MLAITRGDFGTWSFSIDDYLIKVFVKRQLGIGVFTSKYLPKHNSKGIDVGTQSIVLAAAHFWGHCGEKR
jgi:hypothetical protein